MPKFGMRDFCPMLGRGRLKRRLPSELDNMFLAGLPVGYPALQLAVPAAMAMARQRRCKIMRKACKEEMKDTRRRRSESRAALELAEANVCFLC